MSEQGKLYQCIERHNPIKKGVPEKKKSILKDQFMLKIYLFKSMNSMRNVMKVEGSV